MMRSWASSNRSRLKLGGELWDQLSRPPPRTKPDTSPAVGNHVDHRQLLGQPQGVVPDGQHVAQDDDFHLFGDAGQDGRAHVGDALHAEGGGVVLVEHHGVEAHLLGIDLFVQVAVVELGADFGPVVGVGDAQVGALGAHQAGVFILPGLLGKMANQHNNGSLRASESNESTNAASVAGGWSGGKAEELAIRLGKTKAFNPATTYLGGWYAARRAQPAWLDHLSGFYPRVRVGMSFFPLCIAPEFS